MQVQTLLAQAAVLRRAARQEHFLRGGATALTHELVEAALALERAAGLLARTENAIVYGKSLAAFQRGA